MMDAEAIGAAVGSLIVGLGSAIGTYSVMRRRMSADSTELRIDKAERGRISRLEADCEALKRENAELRKQHDDDTRSTFRETAKYTVLDGDYERLRIDYERMRHRARRLEDRLRKEGITDPDEPSDFSTTVMGLDPLEPRK